MRNELKDDLARLETGQPFVGTERAMPISNAEMQEHSRQW